MIQGDRVQEKYTRRTGIVTEVNTTNCKIKFDTPNITYLINERQYKHFRIINDR